MIAVRGKRGGIATGLGLVGVLLTFPNAVWSTLLSFEVVEYPYNPRTQTAEYLLAGTFALTGIGLILIVAGLVIAKTGAPRAQPYYGAPQPFTAQPQYGQQFGQPQYGQAPASPQHQPPQHHSGPQYVQQQNYGNPDAPQAPYFPNQR